jgi:hypothetical protein
MDYALRTDQELSRNDRFSVTLRLGKSVQERREARQRDRDHEVSEQLARQLQEREDAERARAQASGDSALAAERWDDAQRAFRRVLALDPNDTAATGGWREPSSARRWHRPEHFSPRETPPAPRRRISRPSKRGRTIRRPSKVWRAPAPSCRAPPIANAK